MKSSTVVVKLFILFLLGGCVLTNEEKEKLNDAQIDLEQLADQIIITYPANESVVTDSFVTVRADIPAAAEAQEVTLFVDGIEVAKDTDGSPWEINWPSYYWADGRAHTLLLKTVTGGGNEVRNNQQFQVTIDSKANGALKFAENTDGRSIKDLNELKVVFEEFPGATGYDIGYSNGIDTNTESTTETAINLTNLDIGMYEIKYRAKYQYSGETTLVGPWSNTVTVNVLPPDLPELGTPIVENSTTGYELRFSWENLGEGNSYTIYLKNDSEVQKTISDSTTDNSIVISDLELGKYTWQLQRTNSLGQKSLLSDSMDIDVGVFSKRFGGSGDDRAKHIFTTASGEYLVLASTTSKGDSQGDDWVFKLDQQGNVVWEYTYNATGSPKLREILELSNGNIAMYGSSGTWPNLTGLVVVIDKDGNKVWEKAYTKPAVNYLTIKGIAELENVVYIISEGRICTTQGSSTSCKAQAPFLESISVENGAVNSSIQLPSLNNALWDGVSSFSTTSSDDFVLGFSVEKENCGDFFGCWGAGIVIVNTLGQIQSEWNSLGVSSFLNGRYAAESPIGGFVLSGQEEMSNGVPIALFDSNATYIGTFSFPAAYSNQKEYVAFSKNGSMYQLVEKSSVDWPILITINGNGNSSEIYTFTELKQDAAYPAAIDSANDGGLVLLFTENQSGYNNPDVVVVKTGSFE